MRKTTLTILLAAGFALLAAGCDTTTSRKQSAESRWERRMETARLEAASESLAQGRYEYAKRVLERSMDSPGGRRRGDAERLMKRIQTERQIYAQMNAYRDGDSQEMAY